ncbi:MAG: MerC domain-containing protein [Cyclobacteriaceae bacterium]|nr:MerC domain-containing protein [Cyclobacteriaceae bacterium]
MSVIRRNADLIGILSSSLCIVHCLAVPVFIAITAVSHSFAHHHHYHWLDYVFIAFAATAVYFAALRNPSARIKAGLWFSLVLFGIGLLLHDLSHDFLYLSLVGSAGLVYFHILNFRQHRTCKV